MTTVATITVPAPPDLCQCPDGASTQGQLYTLTMPSVATDPLRVRSVTGDEITWAPTEFAYRDQDVAGAPVYDYIVGSAPVSITLGGRVARYERLFPDAIDVFQAEAERVKHWTIVNGLPRAPGVGLNPATCWMGVAGTVTLGAGLLPLGVNEAFDVPGFHLPRPVATALDTSTTDGWYEVVDNADGTQTMFLWFSYAWFLEHPGPWHLDPTVAVSATSAPTASPTQQKSVRCSNGNELMLFQDGTAVKLAVTADEFASAPTVTTLIATTNAADIQWDGLDTSDNLHILYRGSDGAWYYNRGTPNAGRTSWTMETPSELNANAAPPSHWTAVIQESAGAAVVHVFWSVATSNNPRVWYRSVHIASTGTRTLSTATQVSALYTDLNNRPTYPSPVRLSSTQALVSFSTGASGASRGLRARALTFNWGTLATTWSTEESITESTYANPMGNGSVDSTGRVYQAFQDANGYVRVYRRPAGGGTWEDVSPDNVTGSNPVIVVDQATDNAHLFYTNNGLLRRIYSGASWSTATTVDSTSTAAGAADAAFEKKRNTVNGMLASLKQMGTVAMVELGEKFLPILMKGGQWVMANMPTIQAAFDVAFKAIGAVVNWLGGVFTWFKDNVLTQFLRGWNGDIVGMVTPLKTLGFEARMVWESIAGFFRDFRQNVWEPFVEGWRNGAGDMSNVWQTIGARIGSIVQSIWSIIKGVWELLVMYWKTWGDDVMKIARIVWETVLGVIDGALKVVDGIIKFFIALFKGDWQGMWEAIKQIWEGLWQIIVSVATGAWELIKALWNVMVEATVAVFNWIVKAVTDLWAWMWDGITDMVSGAWEWLKGSFGTLWENIKGWFTDLAKAAINWGSDLMSGFWDGITGWFGRIWDGLKDFAGQVTNTVKDALGINSPSRVFMDIGHNLGAGLALGIEGTESMVNRALADITPGGVNMAVRSVGAGGSVTGGQAAGAPARAITIPVYLDGQKIAEYTVDLLTGIVRQPARAAGAGGTL